MAKLTSEWFFTAPLEPVLVRRGDPLGLRAATNHFAEVLAPGLTNRTRDARWITLLSWSLVRAWDAFTHYERIAASESPAQSPQLARRFYEYLRPLELLWIARTMSLHDDLRGRQLPGQRAVGRWLDDRSRPRIGLTQDQYERYRQTGVYGAYRSVLRRLPGLTREGDGWRPGPAAIQLARVVRRTLRVGNIAYPKKKRRRWRHNEDFWLRRGWPKWSNGDGQALVPESSRRVLRLPDKERVLLGRVFFPDDAAGERRRETAQQCARITAHTHEDLCADLANQLEPAAPTIRALPEFTRLADAGVAAMNAAWSLLRPGGDEGPGITLGAATRNDDVAEALDALGEASTAWRAARPTTADVPGIEVADALSDAAACSAAPRARLEALLHHHFRFGGGVKWFRVQSGRMLPGAPPRRGDGSSYRFRLWPLCRLAAQCAVIPRMPAALRRDQEGEELEDDTPRDSHAS